LRGLFVLRQVLATRDRVDWSGIAPIPSAPRGFEQLVGRPAAQRRESVDGIPVVHPPYRVLPRLVGYDKAGGSMAKAARTDFADAVAKGARFVHAHALYPSGDAARMLAAEHALPLVVTVHGSDLYTMLERDSWTTIIRRVARDAATVVCVSSSLAADVSRHLGVAPDRVLVIPDAYDNETYSLIERAPLHAAKTARLVCVGRLEPPKGQDVLVEAISRLRSEGVPVGLTLVGTGSLERMLRARVRDLGLGGVVELAGALPPEQIRATLAGANLYVQPSRREGFGVALVEALATGLPAVATACGGPQDIVGADDGILVEPGDPRALADGILEAMGRLDRYDPEAISKRMAARFAPAVVAGRLVGLYYDVLGGRGSSSDHEFSA
jgi:glycosyltransferase involved in cell wall biosynthesis